jgi:hypothetical protein
LAKPEGEGRMTGVTVHRAKEPMGEGGVHSLAKRKESRTMAVDRKIQYVE